MVVADEVSVLHKYGLAPCRRWKMLARSARRLVRKNDEKNINVIVLIFILSVNPVIESDD